MNAVHPMALQLESTFEATTFVQLDLVLRQHAGDRQRIVDKHPVYAKMNRNISPTCEFAGCILTCQTTFT